MNRIYSKLMVSFVLALVSISAAADPKSDCAAAKGTYLTGAAQTALKYDNEQRLRRDHWRQAVPLASSLD